LTHKSFVIPEKIAKLSIREKYVYSLIRRYIRKYKGSIPVSRKKRSFMIDAPMYKYKAVGKENVIEVTGLKKNKRIDIVLRDKNIHRGNLRIVIENDDLIVIHRLKKVEVEENTNPEYVIGIDKGYTNLFAVSSGRFYGGRLSEFLTKETERLNAKNAQRNKIWALMQKYIEEGNLEKSDIIRKNNFGRIKYNRQKNKFDATAKSYINHETKVMLDTEKPTELALENLNFQSWVKKLPKGIKRKLSRWIKGYIQKRLEYIASLRQVKITMVNPAYTSQVCHCCGSFGVRSGKTFTCLNCGTMDADYNASCNILSRRNDTEITEYTPYKEVKELLLNRYNLSLVS
jgi:transposase